MRRNIQSFGFLLLIIILTGCVTIPFGDQEIEISTDGIEFNESGEGEETANNETNEEDSAEVEAENVDDESASEDVDNEDTEVSAEEDTASNEVCEEEDHSEVTDKLIDDFYIPDCAELASVKSDSSSMKAYFNVPGVDWEEVHNEYKDFFGDKIESESKNNENESTEMTAHLYDDEGAYTRMIIKQKEDHVEFELLQRFP